MHMDKNKNTIFKIDITKLKQNLQTQEWLAVLQQNNVDAATEQFVTILKNNIKESTTTAQINSRVKKLKPWITSGLIKSIRKRDYLSKKVKSQPFNLSLKATYTNYRNTLTQLIRTTKHNYYRNKINEAGNNLRRVWSIINEVTECNTKRDDIKHKIKNIDGDEIDSNNTKSVANTFNEYFVNVGTQLADTIVTDCSVDAQHHCQKNDKTLFMTSLTEDETNKIIDQIKSNTAPGPDGLKAETLKQVRQYIVKPLTYIINLCFTTGKFPDILKQATVIPIFKDGDKQLMQNYRPISLTSHLSKIVEKAMKKRLINFLEETHYMSENQYGFQTQKNTQDAIYSFLNEIYKAQDSNLKSVALFLDLKKAFDTVSHDILLEKLENCRVRGVTLNLLQNHLKN